MRIKENMDEWQKRSSKSRFCLEPTGLCLVLERDVSGCIGRAIVERRIVVTAKEIGQLKQSKKKNKRPVSILTRCYHSPHEESRCRSEGTCGNLCHQSCHHDHDRRDRDHHRSFESRGRWFPRMKELPGWLP